MPDPVREPRVGRRARRERLGADEQVLGGLSRQRYYQGNAVIDEVETLAAERARSLFGAEHANVQPLSGAAANLAIYAALLEPGDTVLGMSLDAGGHLTHGWGVSVTGRWFRAVRYGVRRDTGGSTSTRFASWRCASGRS